MYSFADSLHTLCNLFRAASSFLAYSRRSQNITSQPTRQHDNLTHSIVDSFRLANDSIFADAWYLYTCLQAFRARTAKLTCVADIPIHLQSTVEQFPLHEHRFLLRVASPTLVISPYAICPPSPGPHLIVSAPELGPLGSSDAPHKNWIR